MFLNFVVQQLISDLYVTWLLRKLARSGSTILTETISQHLQLACHHYSDFPMTWMPYWWNSLGKQLPLPKQEPQERAHRDRLMTTADSPEAVEEVLWMHFFREAHKPDRSHVMGEQESHPQFEEYYRDHIRKLLIKQHRLFGHENVEDSRVSRQLKLSGYYEFGPLRCPIFVDESRQAHYDEGLEEVA